MRLRSWIPRIDGNFVTRLATVAATVAGLNELQQMGVVLATDSLSCGETYVVQKGDHLAKIARKCGVSLAELIILNGIDNPDRIFVGQRLRLVTTTADSAPVVQVERSTSSSYLGLAWPHEIGKIRETLASLNMGWFFSSFRPELLDISGYVPITRCGLSGELNGLPADYNGFLIVFNEPNLPEPNGCPLTPEDAASRYRNLRQDYPNAKMVVGNTSVWELGAWQTNYNWLPRFANLITDDPPYAWGTHGYVEEWITASNVTSWVGSFARKYGRRMWVTETGICSGNTDELTKLLDGLNRIKSVERVAFYTDYQPDNVPWGICDGRISLTEEDGDLTSPGQTVSNWENK